MEKVNKYLRGQVWKRNDNYRNKSKSPDSIQHGTRPAVIFSSDQGNSTSPIVNVIPLTLENKPKIPINVPVPNDFGQIQIGLCNQLTPIPKSELEEYLYTLPESIMLELERGVCIANEMKGALKSVNTSCSFDQLKSVIEGIVSQRVNEILKDKEETSNKNDIGVEDIEKLVDSLIDKHVENKPLGTMPKTEKKQVPKKVEVKNTILKEKEETSFESCIMSDALKGIKLDKPKSKPKRNKWDLKTCKQFIEDKDTIPAKDMVVKYGLRDIKQVCQYYYYCKSKISK